MLGRSGFFDASVNFGKDAHVVPPDLGTVKEILTLGGAKRAAAERVRAWLLEHEAKRQTDHEDVISNSPIAL